MGVPPNADMFRPPISTKCPPVGVLGPSHSPSSARATTVKNVAKVNANPQQPTVEYRPKTGRIAMRALSPQQPDNLWSAKWFVGEVVPLEATVFMEVHDLRRVDLLITSPEGEQ